MEGGPPMFTRGFTGLMLLVGYPISLLQVYHLLWIGFPAASQVCRFIRFRSPLLTESRLLSFPEDTEMFHFSSFASHPYTFRVRYPCGWVAPFGDRRIKARLPAPRRLSQVPTSFIASRRRDIRQVPLFASSHQPEADGLRRRCPSVFDQTNDPE